MPKAVWILGDQLTPIASSLAALNPKEDIVLMVESLEKARERNYHKAKLLMLYSAMRHFKLELESLGWRVHYDELERKRTLIVSLNQLISRYAVTELVVMQPAEAASAAFIAELEQGLGIAVTVTKNNMFLTDRDEFIKKHHGKKHLILENFYRDARKKLGVLMEPDGTPTGGVWNFDKENRHPLKTGVSIPPLPHYEKDAIDRRTETDVNRLFPKHIGTTEFFHLPTTRAGAEHFFDDFIAHRLKHFGQFEDAMAESELLLFHSLISPLINIGLLDPMTLVRRIEAAYHASQRSTDEEKKIPLNSAEGFIRQIIGWREFMYGCYWVRMSAGDYHKENFLEAKRKLPDFFWTGETAMNCVGQCVKKVVKHGYVHHIERLMVLGNFALIAGVVPEEINTWFWEFFIDAYDWVVSPNVLGMTQFADGGFVATKPYAASANYISKMSDYCDGCSYDKNAKTGDKACPFNYLYWNFYIDNQDKLRKNSRASMAYMGLDKKTAKELAEIKASADKFLRSLKPNKYY